MMAVEEGFQEPYVFQWPLNADSLAAQCYVVMKRQGGMLLVLPTGFLPVESLQESPEAATSHLGLFTILTVPALQEFDGGDVAPAGFDMDVLVVDVQSDALPFLTLASQELHAEVQPFFLEDAAYPDLSVVLRLAKEWVQLQSSESMAFYSAEESPSPPKAATMKAAAKKPAVEKAKRLTGPQLVAENIKSLAEMVPNIAAQLNAIQEEQRRMRSEMEERANKPPLRPSQVPISMDMQNLGKVLGAPPRTKQVVFSPPPPKQMSPAQPVEEVQAPIEEVQQEGQGEVEGGGSLAMAVLEQSRALTTLVSQLQSGDPLLDSHQSSFSTSSKGAQGREKLQSELSARSGNFMLSVMQLAMRRMRPASPMPTSLSQIAETDFSMVSYLERFGGYGNQRELGTILYALSFVMDAAVREDMAGVQEHLALLYVAIEQANLDQGRWDLAFQFLLLDDPPSQLWSYSRAGNPMSSGRARAFAPLCPQRWATVSLAFLKELDFIQNRRMEMGKKAQPAQVEDPPGPPSPKRKRFPKPKGGGGADTSSTAASSSQ